MMVSIFSFIIYLNVFFRESIQTIFILKFLLFILLNYKNSLCILNVSSTRYMNFWYILSILGLSYILLMILSVAQMFLIMIIQTHFFFHLCR